MFQRVMVTGVMSMISWDAPVLRGEGHRVAHMLVQNLFRKPKVHRRGHLRHQIATVHDPINMSEAGVEKGGQLWIAGTGTRQIILKDVWSMLRQRVGH